MEDELQEDVDVPSEIEDILEQTFEILQDTVCSFTIRPSTESHSSYL